MSAFKTYQNRQQAGRQLADRLVAYKGPDTVILALPRGGVVLGLEIALKLQAPLGVVLVRKIGHPQYEEFAVGAVAGNERAIYNEQAARQVDPELLKQAEANARALMKRRRDLYYDKNIAPPNTKDKNIILVDDGIATGLTMQAAVWAVKKKHPKQIIIAVPVASNESVQMLSRYTDNIILLDDPDNFLGAVGAHYQNFEQVSDEQVKNLLMQSYAKLL